MKKLLFTLSAALLFATCLKDLDHVLKVNTLTVLQVDYTTAEVSAEIWTTGTGLQAADHGFAWSSVIDEPTIDLNDGDIGLGAVTVDRSFAFSYMLTNLDPATDYFVRAFIRLGSGEVLYGETISLRTRLPVNTDAVSYPGGYEVRLLGSTLGIEEFTTVGFCWSERHQMPEIETDNFQAFGAVFQAQDFDLAVPIDTFREGVTYHFRAYAVVDNGARVLYGEPLSREINYKNVWLPMTGPPKNMAFHSSFSLGGKGYVLDDAYNNDPTGDIYEFDPEAAGGRGRWRKLPQPYPGRGKELQSTFTIDHRAYVGRGRSPGADDFWVFDPEGFYDQNGDPLDRFWVAVAPFEGRQGINVVTFTIRGKGYVVNVSDGQVWEFDPHGGDLLAGVFDSRNLAVRRGKWWPKESIPSGANRSDIYVQGFAIGDTAYVGVGKQFYLFEPTAGTQLQINGQGAVDAAGEPIMQGKWDENKITSFAGEGYVYGTSFVIGRKAYFGLAEVTGLGINNQFWEFDPRDLTDPWTRKNDFLGKVRRFTTGFAVTTANGNRGYVVSGGPVGWQTYFDCWEYRPE